MAADIVFPEKMEQLDGKSAEEKIKILEDYIRYMTERVDFAFSGYSTKPGFINGTKSVVNVDYINAMDIKASSVDADNINITESSYGSTNWSAQTSAAIVSYLSGYISKEEALRYGADINGDGIIDDVDLSIVRAANLGSIKWNKNGGRYTANLQCKNAFKVMSVLDGDTVAFSAGVNGLTTRNIACDGLINIVDGRTSRAMITGESIQINSKDGMGGARLTTNGLTVSSTEGTANLTSANQTWADGVTVTAPSGGYYIILATFKSLGNYSLYDCSGRVMYAGSGASSFTELDRFELSSNGNSIWYVDSKSQVVAINYLSANTRVKAQFWANAAGAVVETKVKLYRLG